MDQIIVRDATSADAGNIGALHAASWRSAYRGLLLDEYLDNNLEAERKTYWTKKLASLSTLEFVLVAMQGATVAGFIAVLDKPEKGYAAFIDNLHVRPQLKGFGIGGKLMKAAAERLKRTQRNSVYLWVLEGNVAAEKFYLAKGGKPLDPCRVEFGGAMVNETRFAWDRLDALLNQ